MMYTERAALREALREKYGSRQVAVADMPDPVLAAATASPLADGVLIEVGGRTLLAAPAGPFSLDELPPETAAAWSKMAEANQHMNWISGRYVESGAANSNGALWSAGDLEFGALGVRGGPLNWLHQSKKVVGTLADAVIVGGKPETAAVPQDETTPPLDNPAQDPAPGTKPYIATAAAMWPWVWPDEVQAFTEAAAAGQAFQSMECIAEAVQCGSCGSEFPFMQAASRPETVCKHIRERSASRRMVRPSFLGAGTILAPVQPGWKNANVSLMPTASRLAESAQLGAGTHTTSEFELLVAAVLASA